MVTGYLTSFVEVDFLTTSICRFSNYYKKISTAGCFQFLLVMRNFETKRKMYNLDSAVGKKMVVFAVVDIAKVEVCIGN